MKNNKTIIYSFVFLTALYAAIVMLTPSDPATLTKYQVSQGQLRLLTLTIVIPLIFIWLTALYGSIRFKDYSKVIEDTKEGLAFKYISRGLLLLAFSLPVSAVMSAIITYVTVKNPHLLSTATILKNYLNLLLPAAGLLTINKGATELVKTLRKTKLVTWPPFTLPGVIIISSIYTWLITTRPLGALGDIGYHLPNWIILATLSIPYLYVWVRGIHAAYKIFVYKHSIRGLVYIKSLDYLAKGIGVIIVLSVLSQLLVTSSARLSRLNLTPILLIVYLLLVLMAIGYGFVARGAKKLKQIEEV